MARAKPKTIAKGPPRNAATLILVDETGRTPRILMGRRRPDQVFLPNKFVFPGGRLDPADKRLVPHVSAHPADEALLTAETPDRSSAALPLALMLTAIRETFEETGLIVGTQTETTAQRRPAAWQPFFATGHAPNVQALRPFARAITPPGRPRCYDTRFFIASANHVAETRELPDGELAELSWFTLKDMAKLDLASITRLLVTELEHALAQNRPLRRRTAIPFFRHADGHYTRKLLRAGT